MSTNTGRIQVTTDNIFPIIKKFLYSDHEIFLRELVANAIDASQKLKTLAEKGVETGDLGALSVHVSIDKENSTLHIKDRGLGMTSEEIEKYITQIAFSGAREFLEKYEDAQGIIGKFGLGFYSAFMVADQVEVRSLSYQAGAKGISWSCNGSPDYEMKAIDLTDRGTEIILHINEENKEFLEEERVKSLLEKYCRFLPVPIFFGSDDTPINITQPAWVKNPSSLTDEDYKNFYKELYPNQYDEPLFWIHLNVDYPFNLTGILFFPKVRNTYEIKKNRINLYCRQVFVTDHVEEIVPEFMMLLEGVIDSPDIPLNVSRSYLQSDPNVKKISNYITKKVAARLEEMFKENRADYEQKWEDISVFIKYGIISEDKFKEKAESLYLLKSTDGKYYTKDEWYNAVKDIQTDKNNKTILLYTNDEQQQNSYITAAKDKGYTVLEFNHIIDPHFISHIEHQDSNIQCKRVDADPIDQLVAKEDAPESILNEDQQNNLKELFGKGVNNQMGTVEIKSLSPNDFPVQIVKPEFMRRMTEMQQISTVQGNKGFDFYSVIVNGNHAGISRLLAETDELKKTEQAQQLFDLALLQQNMLKGESLTAFLKRSIAILN